MHLCFALHEGQAENPLYVFPYDLNTCLIFIVSFSWSFICVYLHVYNMVAKFYCQDYIFHAHVLSSYDPSSQMLTYMIKIVYVHVTSKIISFVITYLLEDEQELSLGMLDTSPMYL
jgi:predicted phosphatase